MNRSRNFMWTLNNYTDEEVALLQAVDCKYMTWGFEVGDSGTPHLQGLTIFKNPQTVKQVICLLPTRVAEIQIILYLQESLSYAHKDGNIYEAGSPPLSQAGKGIKEKERHRSINLLAKQGNLSQLEELYPDVWRRDYCKLKLIAKDHMVRPDDLTVLSNEWIWGPTGTGKTRDAHAQHPNAYLKSAANNWWDGYNPLIHDVVIIDDFDKYHIKQGFSLKIWSDHPAFIAETKGGSMFIRPQKLIVTSNYSIQQIWDDETTYAPLLRRFNQIHKQCLKTFDETAPTKPKPIRQTPSSPVYSNIHADGYHKPPKLTLVFNCPYCKCNYNECICSK